MLYSIRPQTSRSTGSGVFPAVYQYPAAPLPEGYRPPHGQRAIRLQELDLYVTMSCNLHCRFCSVRAGEFDHLDLSFQRICTLLDEARALGLEEVHFLGGEPAIRKDLEEMVAYASGLGLHTRIITDGMLLKKARLEQLFEAGLKEIMISVDGLEDTHNELRQSGTDGWRRTMECARNSVAIGLRTRISAVAYRSNRGEMVDLMQLSSDMGAQIFSVFLGSPLGRGHTLMDQVIDAYTWRELQEDIKKRADSVRPDMQIVMEQGFVWEGGPGVDRAQLKGRGTGCNTLLEDYDYLIVRSDGDLYQCVFFMTEGKPIGNIRSQRLEPTLQYALDQAVYRRFTVANDRCTSCFHQEDCGTGCRGYAYLMTGDWLKTDPRCSKQEPGSSVAPPYYPVCPIMKLNVRSGAHGGSTEQALASERS